MTSTGIHSVISSTLATITNMRTSGTGVIGTVRTARTWE